MAARVGLETIHRLRPGFLERHVELLLPELVEAFEPHWLAGEDSGDTSSYLSVHATAVSHDLLAVTDRHAAQASDQTAVVVYERLRPMALGRITEHMPRIAALVQTWVDRHGHTGIAGAA